MSSRLIKTRVHYQTVTMNSSEEFLISSQPPKKIRYKKEHCIVQKKIGKDEMGKSSKHGSNAQYACAVLTGFLIIGMIFSFVGVFGFYINHLQRQVSRLEERIYALEISSRYQNQVLATPHREDTAKVEVKNRYKRGADCDDYIIEQSQKERGYENDTGIASPNIAMLYGDPQKLLDAVNVTENERWRPKTTSENYTAFCATTYERTDKHIWCRREQSEIPEFLYRTSRFNHRYNYFEKASWMNGCKSEDNYEIAPGGRIEVKHQGIYIVHTSVLFTKLMDIDFPRYSVYKTNALGRNRRLISKCTVDKNDRRSPDASDLYVCEALQLIYLKEEEQVYMSIGGYSWFKVEKETFHLTLIKLNGYSL